MTFPTNYAEIVDRIGRVRPIRYTRTRNFIDGDVTYLSPYISRGVISTRQVLDQVLREGHSPRSIEKFIQELAWRDHWQLTWRAVGNQIDADLRNSQGALRDRGMPSSVHSGTTGVTALDNAVNELYTTGYMHNHVRMYTAAISCNIGSCHWLDPARWMYYHLLDGDWASNALSWQWVAGTNSNKKYIANQANINKYCHTQDERTFLSMSYEDLANRDIPEELMSIIEPVLVTRLPANSDLHLDPTKPTLIYNWYNLDPHWLSDWDANRILLLEPSVFERYPISENSVSFMMGLSSNIQNIQVFTGEFHDLTDQYQLIDIHYKEHPLNVNYTGTEHPREWLTSVEGSYRSFFAYWKRAKKELIS